VTIKDLKNEIELLKEKRILTIKNFELAIQGGRQSGLGSK
jgi:hypothetical protein